jgi:MerR family redox-sensitive transcriptional activator SoxR
MTVSTLTIGEVARRSGLRPSALRYYEELGLLDTPQRHGKHRRYDANVFQRLTVIRLAQRAGFTMAEIGVLLNGFAVGTPAAIRWRNLAEQKLAEVEEQLRRGEEMRRLLLESLRCGCLALDQCAAILLPGELPDSLACTVVTPTTSEGAADLHAPRGPDHSGHHGKPD